MPNYGKTHDPSARIEHLVKRIKDATKKGEKLYWAQQEVRDLCQAHGLEIPPEAQKKRGIKQDAPPQQLESAASAGGPVQPDPKPSATEPQALVQPLAPAAPEKLLPLPEAAARFRALRNQALELLPMCQGLSREEAAAVEHQIDLLADVLAVGVRLAHEVA